MDIEPGTGMVFIDHPDDDTHAAERLVSTLEANGVACLIDIRDRKKGESGDEFLMRGLRETRVFIPVVTREFARDPRFFSDIEAVARYGHPMLCYMLFDGKLPQALLRLPYPVDIVSAFGAPEFVTMSEVVRRIYRIFGREYRETIVLPMYEKPREEPLEFNDSVLREAVCEELGIQGSVYPSDIANVELLDLSDRGICELAALAQFPSLRTLILHNNNISYVNPLSHMQTLEILDLSDNNIDDMIPLAELRQLRELKIEGNAVSPEEIEWLREQLPNLSLLTESADSAEPHAPLYSDRIVSPSRDEQPRPRLEDGDFEFTDPRLEDAVREAADLISADPLRVSDIRSIERLDLSSRRLRNIEDLREFVSLRELYLHDNSISDISPIEGLHGLAVLSLSQNRLTDIAPLSQLFNLRRLWIATNEIEDISALRFLTSLRELYAQDNAISDIAPLREMTQLVTLSLRDNMIYDLSPLSYLASLERLWLYGNRIVSLKSLSGLKNLRELYIHDNHIADASPLAELGQLERLWLGGNSISDIAPLLGIASLRELRVDGNPLSREDIARASERGSNI